MLDASSSPLAGAPAAPQSRGFARALLLIFGALGTRRRPVWATLHIFSLLWGIAVEAGPWPCPLTLAEQYFETRAGIAAYRGSFLLHTLDAVVYPGLPAWLITAAGVAVCTFNLGIYARRLHKWRKHTSPATNA